MDLSVSIVTYKNDEEILMKAVNSVLDSEGLSLKLYIVDNSPTDELRHLFVGDERIEYLFGHGNVGYGSGHNIAIRKSMEQGCKYHAVLNPDLCFESSVLKSLRSFMDINTDVGLCIPNVMDYYEGYRRTAIKLLPTPFIAFLRGFIPDCKLKKNIDNRYILDFADYSKVLDAPYISGCFMFFRNEHLSDIGLFDDKIFMYYEDTDISRRMYVAHRNCFVPDVTVKHIGDRATHKSKKMMWITIKSGCYYFNKYGWLFDSQRRKINEEVLRNIPKVHES